MGHLEFVLKHPCYTHLRENVNCPAIICPSKQESRILVRQMVTQALALQPDAKFFHIGADEVAFIGMCEDCSQKVCVQNPVDKWRIYLNYIKDLVLFIREDRPDITILMWDDIMRGMSPEILKEYKYLSDCIDLVIWNYEMMENFKLPLDMWSKYSKSFPRVWAASAYKGANGSGQLISPVRRYVGNQEAWICNLKEMCARVVVLGIIFTGWSRYDHFATLCELLPTSMNSLANCLMCYTGVNKSFEELYTDNTLSLKKWPGLAVARCVRDVAALRVNYLELVYGDMRTTWLNNWQLNTGFLNMYQVDVLDKYIGSLLCSLKAKEDVANTELSALFGPRTRTEWVATHFGTMEKGLLDVRRIITELHQSVANTPSTFLFPPWTAADVSTSVTQAPKIVTLARATVDDLFTMSVDPPAMAAFAASTAPAASTKVADSLSMAVYQPSTIAEAPLMVGDAAKTDPAAPSKVEDSSSMVVDQPSTIDEASLTVGDAVSTDIAAPLTVSDAPSMVPDAPSIDADAPSTAPDAPSKDQAAPSTVADAPSTVPDAPSMDADAASTAESAE